MNRRKKGNQILKARVKKAKAKLAPSSGKPRYISKAERAKLEEQGNNPVETTDAAQPVQNKVGEQTSTNMD